MKQEVARALESSLNDPCYPVHTEKEMIKRIEGFDMPWVKCIPLEISVVWDVYENGGRRNENEARYTLEEKYPGYLKIEYDMENMKQINGFYIGGPSPKTLDRLDASLREVLATFYVYTGPDRLEGVITTNDPSDFTVHKGTDDPYASIAISNNVPPRNHSTIIKSSSIIPSNKLVKYPVAGILETLEGSTLSISDGDIMIEEVERGLEEKNLEKKFTVHEFTDYPSLKRFFKREGTATVKIIFAPLRERWQVMVNTINLISQGSRDRDYGIQVHTERMVEIVIENGEFRSAEGETHFVSIKPYSTPASRYRCQEENIEVVGTGLDAEAEMYDQVRHSKRFHPPKNAHDEALKEKFLNMENQKTPFAFPKKYQVKGTKSGSNVDLFFPKESGYVIAYRCDRIDDDNKNRLDHDRFLFPETIKILLEDDWYTENHYTTKFYGKNIGWKECPKGTYDWPDNTDQIRVKRIE